MKNPQFSSFIIIFLTSTISLVAVFLNHDFKNTLLFSIVLLVLLWFGHPLWRSGLYWKNRTKTLTLLLGFSLVGVLFNPWFSLIEELIIPHVKELHPGLKLYLSDFSIYKPIVLMFWLVLAYIVNREPKTIIQTKLIENKLLIEGEEQLLRYLSNDLRIKENKIGFPIRNYIDISIRADHLEKNKIYFHKDIEKAFKKHFKNNIILMLGQPGSGKSVLLKRITRFLLNNHKKLKLFPIYVNLADWQVSKDQINKKMEDENFYNFVKVNLIERNLHLKFLLNPVDESKDFFDYLWQKGSLYFLLDSYDENANILTGTQKESERSLSSILDYFLQNNPAGGLMAARYSRQPTQDFTYGTLIELLPLNEFQIMKLLGGDRTTQTAMIRELFEYRPDLASLAANPLYAGLLQNYILHHSVLPRHQSIIFDYHVKESIAQTRGHINVPDREVLDFCKKMAATMHLSNRLEISKALNLEGASWGKDKINLIVSVLHKARIIRSGSKGTLSFSHQRYAEYFMAIYLLDHPDQVAKEKILTHATWRDTLILYATLCISNKNELIQEKKIAERMSHVKELADGILNTMKELLTKSLDINSTDYWAMISSMRFLAEVLRRHESFSSERKQFLKYIEFLAPKHFHDLIMLRQIASVIGVFDSKYCSNLFQILLKEKNNSLIESLIKSCRHFRSISDHFMHHLFLYVQNLTMKEYLTKRRSLLLSFDLTDGYRPIKQYMSLVYWDFVLLISGLVIAALIDLSGSYFFLAIFSCLVLVKNFFKVKNFLQFKKTMFVIYLFLSAMVGIFSVFFYYLFCSILPLGLLPIEHSEFLYEFEFEMTFFQSKIFWYFGILFSFFPISLCMLKDKVYKTSIRMLIIAFLLILLWALGLMLALTDLDSNSNLESIVILSLLLLFFISVAILMKMASSFYKSIRKSIVKNHMTRNRRIITADLKAFQGYYLLPFLVAYWQLKYLNLLRRHYVEFVGDWPDERLPYFSSEKVNTTLSQMESVQRGWGN